jgi:hypothetical protein
MNDLARHDPPIVLVGEVAPEAKSHGALSRLGSKDHLINQSLPIRPTVRVDEGNPDQTQLTSVATRVTHVLALKRRVLRMSIENRNLEARARLVGRYKGKTTVCLVEAGEEGAVVFRLEGKGKTYKSLSSAATEITKGPINGWKFWTVEGEETAKPKPAGRTPKTNKPETKPSKRTSRRPTYKVIHLHENQDDLQEGEVRWLCDACIKSFVLPAGEEPTECPNGHRVDDAELSTGAVAAEAEAE